MESNARARDRIAICHAPPGRGLHLVSALGRAGFRVVACRTAEALVERAVQSAPDLIGCTIGALRQLDLGVLRLLRRFWPDAPFVVACDRATIEDRRLVQELRPIYILLEPWNEEELTGLIAPLQALRPRRVFDPLVKARGAG